MTSIQTMENTEENFPLDIIIEILSWLPVKSLLRFKCVSKSWYGLINDPKFIKFHLNRSNSDATLIIKSNLPKVTLQSLKVNSNLYPYYEVSDYSFTINNEHGDRVHLIGSCNGLLCLSSPSDVSLYNPATRAFKTLPRFDNNIIMDDCFNSNHTTHRIMLSTSLVFGYDGASDDYKILKFIDAVQIHIVRYARKFSSMIYSLKANNWEAIENPPWDTASITGLSFYNVLVNNSFHWLHLNWGKEIKCFDLFTKRYYEMPLPDDMDVCINTPRLVILKGNLCIVTYKLDIWMLKEYGNNGSWTRLFRCNKWEQCNTFDYTRFIREWNLAAVVVTCVMDDQNNVLVVKLGFTPLQLICCDLESQEARNIVTPGEGRNYMRLPNSVRPWAESLVPLS